MRSAGVRHPSIRALVPAHVKLPVSAGCGLLEGRADMVWDRTACAFEVVDAIGQRALTIPFSDTVTDLENWDETAAPQNRSSK
ncbi:hypothetical protein GCM10007890_10170 [Methylobacterium tardum]|uniref:Uncharacterized protein n=1 Tax=Methylobacterium tardum TaxID=374432 RepID=A0AA37T8S0_9HYPH|nr:hypothetical protein GCM10007890_10170 [Methylobacterium tardum]